MTQQVVRAFQRHWVQTRFDGIADGLEVYPRLRDLESASPELGHFFLSSIFISVLGGFRKQIPRSLLVKIRSHRNASR